MVREVTLVCLSLATFLLHVAAAPVVGFALNNYDDSKIYYIREETLATEARSDPYVELSLLGRAVSAFLPGLLDLGNVEFYDESDDWEFNSRRNALAEDPGIACVWERDIFGKRCVATS